MWHCGGRTGAPDDRLADRNRRNASGRSRARRLPASLDGCWGQDDSRPERRGIDRWSGRVSSVPRGPSADSRVQHRRTEARPLGLGTHAGGIGPRHASQGLSATTTLTAVPVSTAEPAAGSCETMTASDPAGPRATTRPRSNPAARRSSRADAKGTPTRAGTRTVPSSVATGGSETEGAGLDDELPQPPPIATTAATRSEVPKAHCLS